METETLEKKSSIELAKEKAQKEWIQEDKPKSARFKPAHESLVAWDDARRAREINEKAILDVMFANMDDKLEQGENACNDLLKYVKELARSQHEFVKSFGKLGNALDERYHYGSLENAVVVLKMHSINACSIYEEHNKILTETIANQLSQLVTEYSKQSLKVLEAAKKSNKDYDQAREASNKAFSGYVNAFDEYLQYEKTGIIPAHDPLMAEKHYQQSLEILKTEREKSSAELEQIFENFMVLEEKRIVATKDVLQMHAAKQKLIFNRLSEGITSVEAATEEVNTVADRQLLMKQSFNRRAIAQTHLHTLTSQIQQLRAAHAHSQTQGKTSVTQAQAQQLADLETQHAELRADLGAALSNSQSLSQLRTQDYANAAQEVETELRRSASADASPRMGHEQLSQQKSPMEKSTSLSALERQKEQNFGFRNSMEISKPPPTVMEPPKTGYLFRKSKIMKSWKQTHCILSSSGYMYIFSKQAKPNPKYTVPLTNVAVTPISDSEEPNVFELIVNQHSFFPTKYLLQAESQESLAEWIALIKTYSGTKK